MTTGWKRAIVRVTTSAQEMNDVILQRIQDGWLLESEHHGPTPDDVDLVFRHANVPVEVRNQSSPAW